MFKNLFLKCPAFLLKVLLFLRKCPAFIIIHLVSLPTQQQGQYVFRMEDGAVIKCIYKLTF